MGIRDEVGRLISKADLSREPGHHRPTAVEQARDAARYKYLLRVASRERLEQAHQEAFTALPPEQRERLFLRLCHDLPEEDRPISSSAAELAHAAVVAQETDRGYLVRMLRRPDHGVTEGHGARDPSPASGDSLFAGSVLAPVAATATQSTAMSNLLPGFETSPEAAQVDPSVFARPPGSSDPPRHAAWQAGIIP
ncbi:hypothetical protein [Terrabacter sp. BE26]|uniref:hypothetical protein n=1 Tax=Terrabacter sp. BE26 TaxID=2898152 RepID=UPI0035BE9870